MFEFLCPNGHKIECPREQIGKPATCPTCGTAFLVPDPAQSAPASMEAGAGLGGGSSTGKSPREPMIEFLCPSGHLLHGPARLQGKAGECPECGARFLIPAYDELSDAKQPAAFDAEPPAAPRSPSPSAASPAGPRSGESPSGLGGSVRGAPGASGIDKSQPPANVLAQIVTRLWPEKSRGAVLELHMADGAKIIPHWFAKKISQHSHGVFAVEALDGSYTLSVVPWDQVHRVELRGVKLLPDGMIE